MTSCLARKGNRLGSSKQMVKLLPFSGLLGNKAGFNPGIYRLCSIWKFVYCDMPLDCLFDEFWLHFPDFYNWNRVKIRYCDGSSFTGDVEEVNPVSLEQ